MSLKTILHPDQSEITEMNIKGYDVIIIKSTGSVNEAFWLENNIRYSVLGTLSSDEIIKIIESIDS